VTKGAEFFPFEPVTNRLFLVFVVCELAYVASARLLARYYHGQQPAAELYWTGLRAISAVVLWWIYRRAQKNAPASSKRISWADLPVIGMLVAPVVTGTAVYGESVRHLFAATSLVVGLREELAYRAVLQDFLRQRSGPWAALIVSNVAFVAYHYGVEPFEPDYVLQLLFVGLILGAVYEKSGSLALVVMLHFVYDALWCYAPFLPSPLPYAACVPVFAVTLIVLLIAQRWRRAA
jgi:membrane protease YdiL (CAAX protease family)